MDEQQTEIVEQPAEVVEQEHTASPEAEEAQGSEEAEGQEEAEQKPAEEPAKPWKKGPPEMVPHKVLSERTATFRAREAELQAQIQHYQQMEAQWKQTQAAAAPSDPAPDMANYKTYEEYAAAERAWVIREAKREALQEFQQQGQASAAQQRETAAVATFQQRLAEAHSADPEVGEIQTYLAPAWGHLPREIQQAIVEDDNPAAALRALANLGEDLEDVVRIARSNPIRALTQIGRLSAQYATPATRQTAAARPSAPPPMRVPPTQAVAKPRTRIGDDPGESVDVNAILRRIRPGKK